MLIGTVSMCCDITITQQDAVAAAERLVPKDRVVCSSCPDPVSPFQFICGASHMDIDHSGKGIGVASCAHSADLILLNAPVCGRTPPGDGGRPPNVHHGRGFPGDRATLYLDRHLHPWRSRLPKGVESLTWAAIHRPPGARQSILYRLQVIMNGDDCVDVQLLPPVQVVYNSGVVRASPCSHISASSRKGIFCFSMGDGIAQCALALSTPHW